MKYFRTHVRRIFPFLGNRPPLPDDEAGYVEFFRSIFREFSDCDCINLGCIMVGSYCWKLISQSQRLRRFTSICVHRNETPHYYIELPDSFAQYTAKFKSKMRYNLRREVKQLCQRGSGQLELVHIEHENEVNAFLGKGCPDLPKLVAVSKTGSSGGK